MAAIDPSAPPLLSDEDANAADGAVPLRATLKIIRQNIQDDDDDYEEDDYLNSLLGGSDSEDESDEEAANGGPSDPEKAKKLRQDKGVRRLMKALANGASEDEDEDEEMEDSSGANGVAKKSAKGKAPATDSDEDSDEGESIDVDDEIEEFVLCTLSPNNVSQNIKCAVESSSILLT
jgi:FK506-binding nuclear protein